MENKTKFIIKNAMIAASYAALTLSLEPISYGQIQLRLSEILILMIFFDRKYIYGLTMGCAIANLLGPFGVIDMIFGTVATFIALILMIQVVKVFGESIKTTIIASFFPVVTNGVIIGIELNYLLQLPLIATGIYVAAGEFITVMVIGVPVYLMLKKNKRFSELAKI